LFDELLDFIAEALALLLEDDGPPLIVPALGLPLLPPLMALLQLALQLLHLVLQLLLVLGRGVPNRRLRTDVLVLHLLLFLSELGDLFVKSLQLVGQV
jgi:hypothetical protein